MEEQQQLPLECQVTTDDLAMMVGEAAIRERQAAKIQRYQTNQVQALAVEDVGRVDDWRRIALRCEAGRQPAPDLARTDGVDQHAMPPHQV